MVIPIDVGRGGSNLPDLLDSIWDNPAIVASFRRACYIVLAPCSMLGRTEE